jgi:tRNA pseudouridine(55) synthase
MRRPVDRHPPRRQARRHVVRRRDPRAQDRLGGAKVGHLGTLDPFASGLLPLCIGEATKVARYLLLEEKAYEGRIRLGRETDTLDGTGTETGTAAVPAIDAATLERARTAFVGPQRQTPPMYSALKRDGVPLYKLARQGVEIEREARDITIHAIELRLVEPTAIDFAVRCSKGTYVRVCRRPRARARHRRASGTSAARRSAVRIEQARTPDALKNRARRLGADPDPRPSRASGASAGRAGDRRPPARAAGRLRESAGDDGEAALVLDEAARSRPSSMDDAARRRCARPPDRRCLSWLPCGRARVRYPRLTKRSERERNRRGTGWQCFKSAQRNS